MRRLEGFTSLLIIFIVAALIVISVSIFIAQKTSQSSGPSAAPSASPQSQTGIKNWVTYSNYKYGFSITYPNGWTYSDKEFKDSYWVGFGPEENSYYPFSVTVYTSKNMEELINNDGGVTKRSTITVSNNEAVLVTQKVKTPDNLTKEIERVYLQSKGKVFSLSNSSDDHILFTTFYSSFKLK